MVTGRVGNLADRERSSMEKAGPVTSPAVPIEIPPEAAELGAAFAAAGHQLHLVGGPVRDALMGRELSPDADLDFTTDARPEDVLAIIDPLAAATWTTGIEFGTVGS